MPRESKQTWHRLSGWVAVLCGSWKCPAVLQQFTFILFIYSVLCYWSSPAACKQLRITTQITSDWSWHGNRAVDTAGCSYSCNRLGRQKRGNCVEVLVPSPLGALGSHNTHSKSGCAACPIFLQNHKLIVKPTFGKQLVVMQDEKKQ